MLTNTNLNARTQAYLPALIAVLGAGLLSLAGDALLVNMPPRFGELSWRFRFLSSILGVGPQFALVGGVIAAVGMFGGHRLSVRIISLIALALGIVYGPVVILFALDFLQMRRLMPSDQIRAFNYAAMKTAAISLVFVPAFLWAGWRGFQASQKEDDATRRQRGHGLVVGQE